MRVPQPWDREAVLQDSSRRASREPYLEVQTDCSRVNLRRNARHPATPDILHVKDNPDRSQRGEQTGGRRWLARKDIHVTALRGVERLTHSNMVDMLDGDFSTRLTLPIVTYLSGCGDTWCCCVRYERNTTYLFLQHVHSSQSLLTLSRGTALLSTQQPSQDLQYA